MTLFKTDETGKAKLAGAVYDLLAPDGSKLGSFTTDQNGEIFVSNLPYGKGYAFTETKAPSGYALDKTPHTFDITTQGTTVEVKATGKKTPTPNNPNNPKTGDDSHVGLWIALTGVSAGALAFLLLFPKLRRKGRQLKERKQKAK